MPKVSRETATKVQDIGIGTIHEGNTNGYDFTFLDFREEGDIAPLLKGLPDDMCICPHWGHVASGSITFTFVDGHTETFGQGDAFYVPPGHTPVVAAGTEVLMISPEEEGAIVTAVIERNMAAMQDA